ncbi:MAG: Uncharacterised protein [Candidatus Nitrosopelagicus brevis]|nr:MAG: Uncharacterised protein [Candidatus Nitrosopelagicus brevis]
MPGPTRTKMAPPIMDATPIMIESFSDKLRTNPDSDFSNVIQLPQNLDE